MIYNKLYVVFDVFGNPYAVSPVREDFSYHDPDRTKEYVREEVAKSLANGKVDLMIKVNELKQELAEDEALRDRLSDLLNDIANALHGGPKENGLWSFHDLPELATKAMERIAELEA
jgi:uncharacterized protein YicC (UPF0701 family)